MLHVPQGYNWYFDSQKRIGERVAILAVLDVAGREVGAVCVHLENKTHAAAQTLQMRALLDAVDRLPPGIPVFMGDFNTNTCRPGGCRTSHQGTASGHAAPGCGRLRATAARGGRGGFFLLGLQRPSCQAPQETLA